MKPYFRTGLEPGRTEAGQRARECAAPGPGAARQRCVRYASSGASAELEFHAREESLLNL